MPIYTHPQSETLKHILQGTDNRPVDNKELRSILESMINDTAIKKQLTLIGPSKHPVMQFRKKGIRKESLIIKLFTEKEEAEQEKKYLDFDYEAVEKGLVSRPLEIISLDEWHCLVAQRLQGKTLTEKSEELGTIKEEEVRQILQTITRYQEQRTDNKHLLKKYGLEPKKITRKGIFFQAAERISEILPGFDYQGLYEMLYENCWKHDTERYDCLIHGDLKTDNIFVTEKGMAILDPERTAYGTRYFDIANLTITGIDGMNIPIYNLDSIALGEAQKNQQQVKMYHAEKMLKAWQLLGRAIKHRKATYGFLTRYQLDDVKRDIERYLNTMTMALLTMGKGSRDIEKTLIDLEEKMTASLEYEVQNPSLT